MTFIELVSRVSKETGMAENVVTVVLRSAGNHIEEVVTLGERVKWTHFGTFYPVDTKPGERLGIATSGGRKIRFRMRRK